MCTLVSEGLSATVTKAVTSSVGWQCEWSQEAVDELAGLFRSVAHSSNDISAGKACFSLSPLSAYIRVTDVNIHFNSRSIFSFWKFRFLFVFSLLPTADLTGFIFPELDVWIFYTFLMWDFTAVDGENTLRYHITCVSEVKICAKFVQVFYFYYVSLLVIIGFYY